MTNQGNSQNLWQEARYALLHILRATLTLPAQATFFAAALLAIVSIPQANLPTTLVAIATGVGVNALSSILERVARGEQVSDDEIRRQILVTIEESRIAQRLEARDTQVMIAKLFRQLDMLRFATRDYETTILQRLTEQAAKYRMFVDELHGDILALRTEVQGLATREQSEVIIALLQQLLAMTEQDGKQMTVPFLAPPLPPYDLVGRDDLLQDVKQRLFAGDNLALSALNGLPGVGKTTVAVALAHDQEVLAHFQDGVLWAGLGREPDVLTILGTWAMALGFTSDELAKRTTIEERQSLLNAAIGQKHMLLVVDDAWQPESALAFQLGGTNCAHLVTTRQPSIGLDFAGEGLMTVTELSPRDGLALLKTLALDAATAEPDTAQKLVEAVGGLPLALILIGRYLRKESLSDQPRRLHAALERLRATEERLRLEQSQAPPGHFPALPVNVPLSLLAVIGVSDEALEDATRRTLYALSVFPPKPNTFSEEAALAAAAESVETLDALTNAGLLESSGVGRYTLHQTISDYARHKVLDKTTHQRMVKYFVDYVEAHEKDHNALGLETSNVLAALEIASGWKKHPPHLIAMVVAFCDFLRGRGLYTLAQNHLSWAKQSAQSSGHTVGHAYMLSSLGAIEADHGNYAQASVLQHQGLEVARKTNHRKTIAYILTNLGALMIRLGDYERAKEYAQEGLALAREVQDGELISYCLMHLGTIAMHHRNFRQAKVLYQEGLSISREVNHREGIINFLANLGGAAFKLDEIDQAKQCFTESLNLAQEIGLCEAVSSALLNLGVIAGNRGDYVQAEEHIQQSLNIACEIGHRPRIADIHHARGELYLQQQDLESASLAFRNALEVAQEVGMQELVGRSLYQLARIAATQGNIATAQRRGRESLTIFETIGHGDANKVKEWLNGLPREESPT